jgi:hypothetical protein
MLASEDGGVTPFPGRMRLEIHKSDIRETVVVKPLSGSDGLTTPKTIEDGRIEVTISDMLEVLLSHHEKILLIELLRAKKARASEIIERMKGRIGKTSCWELWSNLQQRGLVIQDEADDMYRVGPEWVKELCGEDNQAQVEIA